MCYRDLEKDVFQSFIFHKNQQGGLLFKGFSLKMCLSYNGSVKYLDMNSFAMNVKLEVNLEVLVVNRFF